MDTRRIDSVVIAAVDPYVQTLRFALAQKRREERDLRTRIAALQEQYTKVVMEETDIVGALKRRDPDFQEAAS